MGIRRRASRPGADSPVTRTELARRLGLHENAVRRLLDLDHRSHIDQVARALAAFGKRLEVRGWSRCEFSSPG